MVATVPVFSGETLSVLQGTSPFPGGDFGGGGAPGGAGGPEQTGGWGGGGSFVFETNPTSTLLLAVGGGGGAGGDAGEVAGAGGSNGPGSDATTNFVPSVVGLGGTQVAGGGGGVGNQGPFANGSAGGGPAMAPSNPGAGGSGGASYSAGRELGRGRRRGLLRRRGRRRPGSGGRLCRSRRRRFGLQRPEHHRGLHLDQHGRRFGHHHLPRPDDDDDIGGLPRRRHRCWIPNSCVVFSPVAFPGQTNYDSVGGDGTWSFTTAESGPFNLAFYTTANGDCSQPILPTPVPSWYINQPLSGTDEHVITPPPGATAVAAGASGIVACLGATALPTAPCATPQVILSGHVDTTGPVPLANVCVFVLSCERQLALPTMTDAQGNWSISGLPAGFNVVVGFVPFFVGDGGPCQSNINAPPPPPAGQLQPVFYGNVWANLADPNLVNDPYNWAVDRGAISSTRRPPTSTPASPLRPAPWSPDRAAARVPAAVVAYGSDHAGGSSAQGVSVVGLYGCNLLPTRHDRIRPASRWLGLLRHLVDRPATLVAQPCARLRSLRPQTALSRIKIPSHLKRPRR